MSLKQFFTVLMAASLGVAATVPKPYASLLSPPTTTAPYNPIGSGTTGIPSPIEPPKNMTIIFVNLHGRNIEYAVASDTFVYAMRRVPHSTKKRARDRQLVNAATKPTSLFDCAWSTGENSTNEPNQTKRVLLVGADQTRNGQL